MHLLRPRRADDRRGDVLVAQHPRERELGHRDAEPLGDRHEPLHALEHVRLELVAHHAAHPLAGCPRALRQLGARPVLAGQHALAERRPHDLRDAVRPGERDHVALGLAVQQRVLRLRGDERCPAVLAAQVERGLDLVGRPLAESDVARLAGPHDLVERLHRLLERRPGVVAMALVEVDVIRAQAVERGVDLLQHLLAGEALVLVVHREVELCREHVGVARPRFEHVAEERLRRPERVDVGGVDEVDAGVERGVDAGPRLVVRDAAAVGQPRAEADLRHA